MENYNFPLSIFNAFLICAMYTKINIPHCIFLTNLCFDDKKVGFLLDNYFKYGTITLQYCDNMGCGVPIFGILYANPMR